MLVILLSILYILLITEMARWYGHELKHSVQVQRTVESRKFVRTIRTYLLIVYAFLSNAVNSINIVSIIWGCVSNTVVIIYKNDARYVKEVSK